MEIKTDDFYSDMKSVINEFDTSDYPKDNVYGLPLINKKILGKFKDELNGQVMSEFIGLRAKLYAHKVFETEIETKKDKGIKKCVIQNNISLMTSKSVCRLKNKSTKNRTSSEQLGITSTPSSRIRRHLVLKMISDLF
jgi:hypothetical protein